MILPLFCLAIGLLNLAVGITGGGPVNVVVGIFCILAALLNITVKRIS